MSKPTKSGTKKVTTGGGLTERDKAILKTIKYFPLVMCSYFMFEAVSTTSIKSMVVIFGIFLITFLGKGIKKILESFKDDEDNVVPVATEKKVEEGSNSPQPGGGGSSLYRYFGIGGGPEEECKSVFSDGNDGDEKMPDINTLIFTFVAFYVNGPLFDGNTDKIGAKQSMMLLFLHFIIIYNGFLQSTICKTKVKTIVASYIFGVIFAFIFYYLMMFIGDNTEILHYNSEISGAVSADRCGVTSKKKFKCIKTKGP